MSSSSRPCFIMSSSSKQQSNVCVLLPNKEQLDVAVGPKSTGLEVFSHVAQTLRIKEVHLFGLTVVKDNEHMFLDLEENLSKYFPKLKKQQGIKGLGRRAPPLVLFFKVQFYVENGRLICERKARCLYFTELRSRVLRSECRQQEEVYFQLAAYAMQAELGDRPPQAELGDRPPHAELGDRPPHAELGDRPPQAELGDRPPQAELGDRPPHAELGDRPPQAELGDRPPQTELGDPSQPEQGLEAPPYFQPKDYFPPWIMAKRGVHFLLRHGPKVHGELRGLSTRDATLLFIKESCRLEDVPVTFYRLHKGKKEEQGSALLALTLKGMQVYQEENNMLQLLYDFPWFNVGRLTFLGKKFEIQPDGLPSARKLVFYTGSPFRSRHLLLHLSNSHRLYLSLRPALRHLHQLEESEEKKRYRESYISDDLDLDPGSDGSLSRCSTGSSGTEVDARQPSIFTETLSMEKESTRAGKRLSSSRGSSGIEVGSKTHTEEEEEEQDEEVQKEKRGSQTDDMLHLADVLQGMANNVPFSRTEAQQLGAEQQISDQLGSMFL